MDDYFRNWSGFFLLDTDPPQCFLDVEKHFAPKISRTFHPKKQEPIALAENLCRRLADVVLYAGEITMKMSAMSLGGHIVISSRLVGFYASCKALLDAAAIALSRQYGLTQSSGSPLTNKQQDFNKGAIWHALQVQQVSVHARYSPLKPTMDEIVTWRDASLHRVSPMVDPTFARRPYDPTTIDFLQYEMILDPEPDFEILLRSPNAYQHGPPNYHYDRWRADLLQLCDEVCRDIIATSP